MWLLAAAAAATAAATGRKQATRSVRALGQFLKAIEVNLQSIEYHMFSTIVVIFYVHKVCVSVCL